MCSLICRVEAFEVDLFVKSQAFRDVAHGHQHVLFPHYRNSLHPTINVLFVEIDAGHLRGKIHHVKDAIRNVVIYRVTAKILLSVSRSLSNRSTVQVSGLIDTIKARLSSSSLKKNGTIIQSYLYTCLRISQLCTDSRFRWKLQSMKSRFRGGKMLGCSLSCEF